MVKYRKGGVSVSFASFGGDDLETGYNYFKGFSQNQIFRTLFANSVFWVWDNENKYDEHIERATQFYENARESLNRVQQEAEDLSGSARSSRMIRIFFSLAGALILCISIYWLTFIRVKERSGDGSI